MSRLRSVIYAVLWLFPCVGVSASDYYFRHIGMAEGLPQMSVSDVYQDAEGYMWFATRQGVARYNGRTMTVFNPDANDSNALLSSVVEQLAGDTLMNMYIRTEGGVNRYALRSHTMSALYTQKVEAMTTTPAGLYFAAGSALYHYHAQADSIRPVCTLPSDIGKVCLLQYIDGTVYIGTVDGELYTWSRNHTVTLLYRLGSQISCVYRMASNTICVGTWYDGLYVLKSNGVAHYTTADGLVSDFVRAIYEDHQNVLWIGTDIGLQRFSDGRLFLSGQSVWSLTGDRGGNLWAGTYFDGVFFFNPSIDYYSTIALPFTHFPVISHILPLPQERMVLSTEGDGLYVVDAEGSIVAHVDVPNIKATYYDSAQAILYLGTHLHGLYVVSLRPVLAARSGQTVSLNAKHYDVPFPQRNGSQIIRSIVPLGDSLLLGTHNGVYIFNPQQKAFRLLSEALDKEPMKAQSMVLTADGKGLYIGGEKLVRYDLEKDTVDVLHISVAGIEKLLLDPYGRLWIGTDGSGVWQCTIADTVVSMVAYTSRTCGLQNDYVRNLLLTPMGHILVVTTRGYSIIHSHDGGKDAQYPIVNYSPGTYLPLSSLYNGGVALSPNGEILLAGMDGMIAFREEHLHQLPISPTIVLEPPYQYADEIVLPKDKRDVRLHYSIQTNNLYPDNLSLRYNIVCKYNEQTQSLNDWIGDIQLMNLHYGMNHLVLQVIDHSTGRLLAARELAIRVQRPAYLAWPAIVCYCLLLLTIIGGGIYYVRRRFLEALRKQEKNQYVELRKTIDIYIDKHLSDAELNVSQLCKQLGIGRTRLFQVFHDVYDASPQQVITERRLVLAADWLKNRTECNISEIAYDLGYQSPKYFSHCFKERWGLTPSAYRKKYM